MHPSRIPSIPKSKHMTPSHANEPPFTQMDLDNPRETLNGQQSSPMEERNLNMELEMEAEPSVSGESRGFDRDGDSGPESPRKYAGQKGQLRNSEYPNVDIKGYEKEDRYNLGEFRGSRGPAPQHKGLAFTGRSNPENAMMFSEEPTGFGVPQALDLQGIQEMEFRNAQKTVSKKSKSKGYLRHSQTQGNHFLVKRDYLNSFQDPLGFEQGDLMMSRNPVPKPEEFKKKNPHLSSLRSKPQVYDYIQDSYQLFQNPPAFAKESKLRSEGSMQYFKNRDQILFEGRRTNGNGRAPNEFEALKEEDDQSIGDFDPGRNMRRKISGHPQNDEMDRIQNASTNKVYETKRNRMIRPFNFYGHHGEDLQNDIKIGDGIGEDGAFRRWVLVFILT